MIKISEEDMNTMQEMAKKYDLSLVEFGRMMITQNKVKKERQFRISEEEYAIISKKANRANMTVMAYSEEACKKYLEELTVDPAVVKYEIGGTRYGKSRNKRITVRINDSETEALLIQLSSKYNIEIGALLRYCALKY